jgi:glycosyltransferase
VSSKPGTAQGSGYLNERDKELDWYSAKEVLQLMKISVITVCYNSQRTISRTIESFLAQEHDDKEMVVVDGASHDRTMDVAKSYGSPLIRIVSEPDSGIYDAMNKGLRLYNGDAVGFLNSDDTFHDRLALSKISSSLATADVTYGDLQMVADHETKRAVRIWKAGRFGRLAFQRGWAPPHPTFYARRRIIQDVGEFDLRYRIAADYDFMLRAMIVPKLRVAYLSTLLVDFQIGGASTGGLGSIISANLECLDSRRRHINAPPLDIAFFIKPARKILQLNQFHKNR